MKIKALSLLMAICMVVSLFPAVTAVEPTEAPVPGSGVQEHIHETEPVLPQAEKAPDAEPEAAPVLPLGIEEYPALTYDVEMTLACTSAAYSYVTFTPERSGSYRFYSQGSRDTVASLYNAQMGEIAYNDDCHEGSHAHEYNGNFCLSQELEAGVTYVLGVKYYYGSDADMTIGVTCSHTYTADIDAQEGTATFTCSTCGDSYSTETVTLEYDGEVTVTAGEMGYPYVLFTPETSGGYRFHNGKEGGQGCDILDMNLEPISDYEYNYMCNHPFHGHPDTEMSCKIAQLEGGVTYILEPVSDYETDTVTISVSCGHVVSVGAVEDNGDVEATCGACGLVWTTQVVPLHLGEGSEEVLVGGGYRYTYMGFTAEHTGTFLFYSTGNVETSAYVYDSDLEYYKYLDECTHEPKHTEDGNFCGGVSINEGDTVILSVRTNAPESGSFMVYTACSHWWSRSYSPETGLVTYTCTACGDSFTEEPGTMEFDAETTLMCNGETYSYVTFTPETSGKYRLYGIGTYPNTDAVLYDSSMNEIDHGYSCWEDSHGHETTSNFCFTSELEAGVTYVLAVRLDATGWLSDTEVTIAVTCGHEYISEVTQEATCAQPGICTYTCQICGHTYSEDIVVPHKLVSEITEEGTCAEPGTIVHTCDVCGHTETEDYKTRHSYECEVIQEATCTEDGLERYTCTVCGDSYDRDIWSRHDYQREEIPGTCTQMHLSRKSRHLKNP